MKFAIAALALAAVSAVDIQASDNINSHGLDMINSEEQLNNFLASTSLEQLDEDSQMALASALQDPAEKDMAAQVMNAIQEGTVTEEQWAWLDKD